MLDDSELFTDSGRGFQGSVFVTPLLEKISSQSSIADQTRSIDESLIRELKDNDIMRISASAELGGLGESVVSIANELRAIAPRCTSTAWFMWNHLCTFHHFAGLFGPKNKNFLTQIVANQEWVCFPAGASSKIIGSKTEEGIRLNGVAAFGSGSRYSEWAGVVFNEDWSEDQTPCFSMVDLRKSSVRVEQTWEAMSVRASSTDHIYYDATVIPEERVVPWPLRHRENLRDPEYHVINDRYREDWVGLSVVWLGAMATGLVEVSLNEVAASIKDRIAIFGTKMVDKPTIHTNLGRARALLNAATDTVYAAMIETDTRITQNIFPVEGDYFRQTSSGMQAVLLCEEAMKLILRVSGGNGLREGTDFERRYRDFQAFPLHINGHADRITEQLGRISLGLESENVF